MIFRKLIPIFLLALLGAFWSMHLWGQEIDRNKTLRQEVDSLERVIQAENRETERYRTLFQGVTPTLTETQRGRVLWATRAVLSETKDPGEMLLIANVIRNRVDMGYRGQTTAQGVVLDPYQFSAFNPARPRRNHYIRLSSENVSNGLWMEAWFAARFAMTAPRELLPLRNPCINHFVHPVSLRRMPNWTSRMERVDLGDVDRARLSFFKQKRNPLCR